MTSNIVISGVGGQGLITLLQIISQAGVDKGLDVKTSELHGLSQRGGSVSVHIRLGKKVYSPFVAKGTADLILALEQQEVLRILDFSNKKTTILINQHQTPTLADSVSESQIKNNLEKAGRRAVFVPATEICKKELGNPVLSGMFLLSLAVCKKAIPLIAQDIEKAIKEVMPKKFWEINIKAVNLAKQYATRY